MVSVLITQVFPLIQHRRVEEAREELLLSAGASDHCSLIFISQSIYSFDLTLNSKEGGFSEEEVFAAGDMDVFLRHTFYFFEYMQMHWYF